MRGASLTAATASGTRPLEMPAMYVAGSALCAHLSTHSSQVIPSHLHKVCFYPR